MEQYNELYHYGVKGMKWGIRKKSYGDGGKVQKQTFDDAKKEYDRHSDLVKKYSKESKKGVNPSKNKYYDAVKESDAALVKKTESYLSTLNKSKTKMLLQKDEEHGRHYVDARIFDKNLNYDSFVYVSDDFAKRYK